MRRVLLCTLGLGVLLVPLAGAQTSEPLQPGVTFEKHVELTAHGPVVYSVITAPAPTGLETIGPVLAGNTVSGPRETVTQIEQAASGTAVVAGVNGDFFTSGSNVPSGIVMSGGALERIPTPAKSSIGFDGNGGMHVGRISFSGTWQGSGQRRPIAGVNQQPHGSQTVLFTPAWGASTPNVANAAIAVLEPFPSAAVDTDLSATVSATGSGSTPIPPDGAVLVSIGSEAAHLQAEAAQGQSVTVRLTLPDSWAGVTSALGGGPVLVKNGKPVFSTTENFTTTDLSTRQPRAAVGQLANHDVILVAVDGGRPGYSVGMTNYELAQLMAELGAVTAAGLQFGNFVTEAFDGQLLNRPSQAAQAPVKEALLVQYAGVYALPPQPTVVGKAGTVQLAYRITQPSQVTATLVDPNGQSTQIDSGSKQPGTYTFTFASFATEGTWHWNVQATDTQNRASSSTQAFTYDLTLGGVTVPQSTAASLDVHFTLSRPASATLAITAANGTAVDTLPSVQLQAGTQTLTWDGTTSSGAKAPPGSYVATVSETSSIGAESAHAAFTLHR
jgi:Phosphodiester glycosidase/FlgD Ig-like domain